jgi:hypothetical protein
MRIYSLRLSIENLFYYFIIFSTIGLIIDLLPNVLYLDDYYFSPYFLSDVPWFPNYSFEELSYRKDFLRQLLIHPPLIPFFYWFYTSIIPQNVITFHLPSVISLFLTAFIWNKSFKIFNIEVASIRVLFTAILFSFIPVIIYSVQAIYAPFEALYLSFVINKLWLNKKDYSYKRILFHVLGVSIFYLYLVFWLLDIIFSYKIISKIYWFMNISSFLLTSSLLIYWFYINQSSGAYQWNHWISPTAYQIFKLIIGNFYVTTI